VGHRPKRAKLQRKAPPKGVEKHCLPLAPWGHFVGKGLNRTRFPLARARALHQLVLFIAPCHKHFYQLGEAVVCKPQDKKKMATDSTNTPMTASAVPDMPASSGSESTGETPVVPPVDPVAAPDADRTTTATTTTTTTASEQADPTATTTATTTAPEQQADPSATTTATTTAPGQQAERTAASISLSSPPPLESVVGASTLSSPKGTGVGTSSADAVPRYSYELYSDAGSSTWTMTPLPLLKTPSTRFVSFANLTAPEIERVMKIASELGLLRNVRILAPEARTATAEAKEHTARDVHTVDRFWSRTTLAEYPPVKVVPAVPSATAKPKWSVALLKCHAWDIVFFYGADMASELKRVAAKFNEKANGCALKQLKEPIVLTDDEVSLWKRTLKPHLPRVTTTQLMCNNDVSFWASLVSAMIARGARIAEDVLLHQLELDPTTIGPFAEDAMTIQLVQSSGASSSSSSSSANGFKKRKAGDMTPEQAHRAKSQEEQPIVFSGNVLSDDFKFPGSDDAKNLDVSVAGQPIELVDMMVLAWIAGYVVLHPDGTVRFWTKKPNRTYSNAVQRNHLAMAEDEINRRKCCVKCFAPNPKVEMYKMCGACSNELWEAYLLSKKDSQKAPPSTYAATPRQPPTKIQATGGPSTFSSSFRG
jgi:hypothetical protein